MKDEIKEIINDLQRVADRKCYPEDILCGSIAQEWGDSITNLQEENRQTKLLKERYQLEKEDYKSRCEKAIPMLKELNIKIKEILRIGIDIKEISDIENILNGGDE